MSLTSVRTPLEELLLARRGEAVEERGADVVVEAVDSVGVVLRAARRFPPR